MEYQLVKVIQRENGVDRVYRPILPEEERQRRERAFLDAAARFLLDIELQKRKDEEHGKQEQRGVPASG